VDLNDERRFAEDVGLAMAQLGMPPAFGKLLGWLLICEPPSQTSAQLAQALDLSKASVSTGMRMLEGPGLVRRVPLPGHRGHAYELIPDGMIKATDTGKNYDIMRVLMDKGLALLDDPSAPRAQRLKISRDFYAFIAERLPLLVAEFKQIHHL
jgi:DNA-binding transcriptional regulator GbsR (MarR family)